MVATTANYRDMLDTDRRQPISENEYQAFQQFLQDACGIVLGVGKEYLVSSRLSSLMRHYDIPDLTKLLGLLRTNSNPRLRSGIIDAMTTNETFWFRDMAHFDMLSQRVLPEYSGLGMPRLRIWSTACSYGQEPYNISMVAEDYQADNPGRLRSTVEILATDISGSVLESARKGVYCGLSASRGLKAEQQKRHFLEHGDCLEVRPEIRRKVAFRELNLTKGYELLGRFDVIFCRNVLIYFSNKQKQDILDRMARIMNPGGYLFLGSTESLAAHTDRFEMVSGQGGIAYRLRLE